MRTVRTHVAPNAFAATMSAMRTWLDHSGSPDVRFEIAEDASGIVISIEFSANDIAYAFERQFGNMPPAARTSAA